MMSKVFRVMYFLFFVQVIFCLLGLVECKKESKDFPKVKKSTNRNLPVKKPVVKASSDKGTDIANDEMMDQGTTTRLTGESSGSVPAKTPSPAQAYKVKKKVNRSNLRSP